MLVRLRGCLKTLGLGIFLMALAGVRQQTHTWWVEKTYWVHTEMMALIAQDGSLSPTELRLLVGMIGLHANGPVQMTQKAIANWLGLSRELVNKALGDLVRFGYLHREDGGYRVDGSIMFCGKRNQKAKRFRMYINETIRERRKRFREKIEAEGHDNRPGWTGYRKLPDGSWKLDGGPGVRWEGEPYTGPCPLENYDG